MGDAGAGGAGLQRLEPHPARGRGRRPSEQVRADILDAAGRLLLAEGVAGTGIERIAAVAGVSKTSIYKWWPSRGVLAIEAYARSIDATFSIPDTGDVERDLVSHLSTFAEVLGSTRAGRVTIELLGAAQGDPALAEAFARLYLRPRRAVGVAALTRAVERGQIRAGVDLEALSDQLWGACMYRLLTGIHPLDRPYVRSLVSTALDGVRGTG